MTTAPEAPERRGHARRLVIEPFVALVGELASWRSDDEIETMDRADRALAFVRGLRLSARLTYIIRDALHGSGVEAHWGHILSADGGLACSRECDVVIHQAACERMRWNGDRDPVMDFWFVPCRSALAVVSCKSFAHSVGDDQRQYCADMRNFVDRVYLFAECCHADRADALTQSATNAGYDGFWYLYSLDRDTREIQQPEPLWVHFVQEMSRLAAETEGGTDT